MSISAQKVISITISLVLVAMLIPLALVYLGTLDVQQIMVNGTAYTVEDVVDSSILTMFMVILPLVAAIGIIGYYIKSKS
jgi:hypothetical protein